MLTQLLAFKIPIITCKGQAAAKATLDSSGEPCAEPPAASAVSESDDDDDDDEDDDEEDDVDDDVLLPQAPLSATGDTNC